MTHSAIAYVSNTDLILFSIFLALVVLVLAGVFALGIWMDKKGRGSLSPYSRMPLRRGSEISYQAAEKVLRYLYELRQYDNRLFDLRKAAVCRETGRIFPDAITWYDTIRVDWTFINKRHPGKYVSWGSLTEEQQEIVRSKHDTMEGFQTEFSSPNPLPRAIELKYALAKPGPLYVDIETDVLLGWKNVPGTELEVLIVQKPPIIITPSVT